MDYRDSRIGFLNSASSASYFAASADKVLVASSEDKVDAYKMVLSGRWSRADFDKWLAESLARGH